MPDARMRHLVIWFVLVLLIVTVVIGMQIFQPGSGTPNAYTHRPADQTVMYRSTPQRDLELHLYSPLGHERTIDASAPAPRITLGRPAVVFFHGGGWISGKPGQFRTHATELSGLGLVVIEAEYRTQETDGTTPQDALDDALHAMAWVRANAESLGLDPTRIAAGGGSAGGHLAAACATVPDEKLAERAPDLPASPRPDALILFNPVLDTGPNRDLSYGHERVGDDYAWFSPTHNVRQGLPPTLIMSGTADHLTPPAVMQNFFDAITAQGTDAELHLYDGQGHGFFNAQPGKEAMHRATLDRTLAFLRNLGWIESSTP